MIFRENKLLSEKEAWADYEALVSSLEAELLDIIGYDREDNSRVNSNATHIAKIAKRFLDHSVPETFEDRVNWHIRFALTAKFKKTESTHSYDDKRIIASGSLEVEHVLATESDDGLPLAVKILHPDASVPLIEVFKNEQAVLTRLELFYKRKYPENIIKLYAIGDGVTATERIVGGKNLREVMKERNSLDDIVRWIQNITDGLEDLYKAGYSSNGDLSPSNCILGSDGIVRLCDLSFVKEKPFYLPSGCIRVEGKDMYMPPEKCLHYTIGYNKEKPIIDKRTDVYIFGIMIHQFLTQGKDPFDRHTFTDEENADGDNLVLAGLAKKVEEYGLDFYTRKGPTVSKIKITEFAKKYNHKKLSLHGSPYIENDEVLAQIDNLLIKCFDFDFNRRPQSPKELLQEFLSILEPILPY